MPTIRKVGDRFFETIGIPILQGRGISEEDLVRRRKVAVVNHAFARRYFGTKNPLGRQVKIVDLEDPEDTEAASSQRPVV